MPMPVCRWLPSLPANARAGLVLLKRPCTFLVALLVGTLGAIAALFYAVTGLEPPTCPCDSAPRTRPRPAQPPPARSVSPPPSAHHSPVSTLEAFTAPLRSATRPPPVRRQSGHGRKMGAFAVHELDGVLEAREEEEAEDAHGRTASPARGWSGSSDDAFSEADTLVDVEAHEIVDTRGKSAKGKSGLSVLTHSLRWIKPSTHGKKDSMVASPETDSRSGSSSPTAPAAPPPSSKGPYSLKGFRPRSATGPHAPRLPSSMPLPAARRIASDGDKDYFSQSHTPPPTLAVDAGDAESGAPSPASPPPLAAMYTRSAVPKTRERASTSLFFRSLSPLSRSPATTPEPSPPTSPRLGAPEPSSSAQGRRETVKRASSLDSAPSLCSRRRRERSPGPQRAPPIASRPFSDAVVDMRGSSGLELRDLLSRSFRT